MPREPEGSTSPRKFSAVELLFYVPDFAIAGTFLITWLAPLTFGPKMIGYLLTVVLVELFSVMAAAIIGAILAEGKGDSDTTKIAVGLAVFMWVFPLAWGLGEGIAWMIWAYWLLLFNRLSSLWHAPTVGEKGLLVASLWVQAGFWMLFAFISARAALPELGVTGEVVRAEGLTGGGAWIGQPHRMLAFGFMYFTAVTVTELVTGYLWAKRRTAEPGPTA